MDKVVIWDFTR